MDFVLMYKLRGFLLSCGSESLAMHGLICMEFHIPQVHTRSLTQVCFVPQTVLLSGTLAFLHVAGIYCNGMGTSTVVQSPTHTFLSDRRKKKGQIPRIRVFSSNSALHVSSEKLENYFLSYTGPFPPHSYLWVCPKLQPYDLTTCSFTFTCPLFFKTAYTTLFP